jgi:hypothetical protein
MLPIYPYVPPIFRHVDNLLGHGCLANGARHLKGHSSTLVRRGLVAMVEIIKLSQHCAFPSQADWPLVASELLEAMQGTQQLADGPRKASANHDKALNECCQGILWVTVDGSSPGGCFFQHHH